MSEVWFYQNTQDQTQLIIPLACQSGCPRPLIGRGYFAESYASSDGRSRRAEQIQLRQWADIAASRRTGARPQAVTPSTLHWQHLVGAITQQE
jgi:hypothetical protein